MLITAPEKLLTPVKVKIFLAGTIDNGNSRDWQAGASSTIHERIHHNCRSRIAVFNPRRKNWDSTWKTTEENSQFHDQVTWELDHLLDSDMVLINFEPGSSSPISLLELGLLLERSTSGGMYKKCPRIYLRCPDDYARVGNVKITARRYNVQIFDSLNAALNKLTADLRDIFKDLGI